ncbi:MAG: GGDEF domain-containing protein, partial [Betaproteobacteria bacterium]
LIWTYLFTQASFLNPSDKMTMMIGTAVYVSVLFFVGKNVNKLTRLSLEQRFEREDVLARLKESHEQESALRERLESESEQLAELNLKLHDLARLDPLTGLFNRRHLMEQLTRELNISQRHLSTFSVILLDLDDFKTINDTYGHHAGDQVLTGLARVITQELREIDLFARWGGEEFFCLLPKASNNEAMICAERLRSSLENARLIGANPNMVVTASFGVATYQTDDDADSIVKRADILLYQAKAAGKNLVLGGEQT